VARASLDGMAHVTAADGARVWYEVAGTGDGLPLVLLQGLALDHTAWDSALADFPGRPVLVLDHRGTGRSDDAFGPGWSTRDFAHDVVAVLDHAGIGRAHVYGHSMGGRIGQWLGAEHAERLASLTLGSTTVGDADGVPRPEHASRALASGDAEQLAALFYRDDWLATHPREAGAVMPAPSSPGALAAHLEAVARHDGPAPSSIRVPTLVLHGGDDELAVPENAYLLAQHVPEAELRLLDGERHAYWVAGPAAHEAVRSFLLAHDPGGA
jgi:pimeloyl-ACP methyl ester carboxylesterase